jgi:hypothetical protein
LLPITLPQRGKVERMAAYFGENKPQSPPAIRKHRKTILELLLDEGLPVACVFLLLFD